MSFDDQFARSQGALHRLAGQSKGSHHRVVYLPAADGTGSDSNPTELIHAIVSEEQSEERPAEYATRGLRWVLKRSVTAVVDPGKAEFCGLEHYDQAGQFMVGELGYDIESIEADTRGDATFQLMRSSQTEITREGFSK